MKYIITMTMLIALTGCSLEPEYQTALNNYAKDKCKGKLLGVGTKTIDGTLHSKMWYDCIEDTGVKTYFVTIGEIPQQYWEIE